LPNKFYYGVGGTASVYNVKVENDQSSASMMWVRNGPIGSKNSINVGWHVSFILLIYLFIFLSQKYSFLTKHYLSMINCRLI
jgi:hypothetical protein